MFVKATLFDVKKDIYMDIYINPNEILMMRHLDGGPETEIIFSTGKRIIVEQDLINILTNEQKDAKGANLWS